MAKQVANWFVNYRGRQWQPLVLELAAEIEAEDAAAADAAAAIRGFVPGPARPAVTTIPVELIPAGHSRKRQRDPVEDCAEAAEGASSHPAEAWASPEVRSCENAIALLCFQLP